jgi:hypothetical protein
MREDNSNLFYIREICVIRGQFFVLKRKTMNHGLHGWNEENFTEGNEGNEDRRSAWRRRQELTTDGHG